MSQDTTVKYATIKRLLGTLDKFLSKKLGLVLLFCGLGVAICAGGVFLNSTLITNASSGGESSPSSGLALNTWLWSGVALFAFIALISIVYTFIRIKKSK